MVVGRRAISWKKEYAIQSRKVKDLEAELVKIKNSNSSDLSFSNDDNSDFKKKETVKTETIEAEATNKTSAETLNPDENNRSMKEIKRDLDIENKKLEELGNEDDNKQELEIEDRSPMTEEKAKDEFKYQCPDCNSFFNEHQGSCPKCESQFETEEKEDE